MPWPATFRDVCLPSLWIHPAIGVNLSMWVARIHNIIAFCQWCHIRAQIFLLCSRSRFCQWIYPSYSYRTTFLRVQPNLFRRRRRRTRRRSASLPSSASVRPSVFYLLPVLPLGVLADVEMSVARLSLCPWPPPTMCGVVCSGAQSKVANAYFDLI